MVSIMTAGAGASGAAVKNHILLVDDDEPFREAIASVLRGAGYRVSMAPDYRLALQILEGDEPVDLLLVDIVMPDRVNGLALSRMARLRRSDIGVIYITGYEIPGLETEALGPIIHKPVDHEGLLGAVAEALRTKN